MKKQEKTRDVVLDHKLRSRSGEAALASAARRLSSLTPSWARCWTFTVARHPRLGAESPARVLNKDLFCLICSLVRAREKLVVLRKHEFGVLDLNDGCWTNLTPLADDGDQNHSSGRSRGTSRQ
jgi:hypothetical protein